MSTTRSATILSSSLQTMAVFRMISLSTIVMIMICSDTSAFSFSRSSRMLLKLSSSSDDTTNHQDILNPAPSAVATTTTTTTSTNTNNEMKQLGNSLILSAARYHGATDKMITIDWKADKIIVTVDVNADETYVVDGDGGTSCFVGELLEDEEGDLELEYDDDYDDIEEELDYYDDETEDFFEEDDFDSLQVEQLGLIEEDDEQQQQQQPSQRRIDLTLIARTINEYLSDGGDDDDDKNTLQFKIAQMYEIEVTTPEFDNVLRVDYNGLNMFEVYKGFDVIVDYWDVPKKKKVKNTKKSGKAGKEEVGVVVAAVAQEEEEEEPTTKTQKVIEGKLVGRDEEKGVTLVNVKGRIMKIKNDMIESVKLPKAKREKGSK